MEIQKTKQSKRSYLKDRTRKLRHLADNFMHYRIHCALRRHFDIMETPKALRLVGMKNLPIRIDGETMAKILERKHRDQISIGIFCKLPQALEDPLMILRSRDREGNINPHKCVVVTDLKDKYGGTVIIPVGMDLIDFQHGKEEHRNKVLSFYGKSRSYTHEVNDQYILDRMTNDDLLYINKKRTANWLSMLAEAPGGLRVRDPFDLSPIIPDETDLRKYKKENATTVFRRPVREESTVTVRQQQRLDAIYAAPMDAARPERLYRKTMMDKLDNLPTLTKAAVHQAERETICVLLRGGITKSRVKKILQERSPLCDTRQSKKDLEDGIVSVRENPKKTK